MISPIFYEICGFEEPSVQKKAKPVSFPWEDTSATALAQWMRPPSGASADVCNKIEDAAFTKAILGDMPKPVAPESEPVIATPNAMADLAKLTKDLVKSASKVTTMRKRASERGPAITKIIDKCLGQYRSPMTAEAFQRLQQSCENYVELCLEAF